MTDATIDTTGTRTGTGWGWLLASGIITVVTGMFMLTYPQMASLAVTLFVGWALMVVGIAGIVGGIVNRKSGGMWLTVLLGALTAVAGLMLAFNLLAGTVTLTMVFVIWLLADGIVGTLTSLVRRGKSWGWHLCASLVTLLLGIVLLQGMPMASATVLGVYAGIVLMFRGMTLTFIAFELRR